MGIIFPKTGERAKEDSGKLPFSRTDNREEGTNGKNSCQGQTKFIGGCGRIRKPANWVEQRAGDNAGHPTQTIHECYKSRKRKEAICANNLPPRAY